AVPTILAQRDALANFHVGPNARAHQVGMPQLLQAPFLDLRGVRDELDRLIVPPIMGRGRIGQPKLALTTIRDDLSVLLRVERWTSDAGPDRGSWPNHRVALTDLHHASSVLNRWHPGRGASPDRVVADLLPARRVCLGISAPAIVEQPRPRITVAVVARPDRHRDDARERRAQAAELLALAPPRPTPT